MEVFFSDEALALVVPIVVYWVYSGVYMVLGPSFDRYRLHPLEEQDSKNLVPKREVAMVVLLQQLAQVATAAAAFKVAGGSIVGAARSPPPPATTSYLTAARQIAVAMVILDAWQFFWHWYMHANQFLYRHVHSWHHRVVVTYAWAGIYNHPVEGLLHDNLGGALAFLGSGMSPRLSILFFSLCMVKTVDIHCGMWLPWASVLGVFSGNNSAYHDLHHQLHGRQYNFSQPFFVSLDKIFGTHMPHVVEERPGGGYQVRPLGFDGPTKKKVNAE